MAMRMGSSVGSTTDASSLSDQIKRYKLRELKAPELAKSKSFNAKTTIKSLASSGRAGRLNPASETLVEKAISSIVTHFEKHPVTEGLPSKFMREITNRLPVNLDPRVTAVHIFDENYWKRACIDKYGWQNCQIIEHGLSWKQLFFENYLQETLEDFPSDGDVDELTEKIKACQDYIFTLRIRELRSHLDLSAVTGLLPNLTKLDVTYGIKQCGMSYVRMMFGMKISDANALANAFATATNLTSVILTGNLMDDDLLRMLMTGLIKNDSVTHLDVSHNKITNHGVRLLSKLLGPDSVMTSLNFADNQIHAEGGRYLGRGLRSNDTLVDLNVRLNRLTDDGGRMLLEGLRTNQTLQRLNLSGNSLGSETMSALIAVLQEPDCQLEAIDLSCNDFSTDDIIGLESALAENRTVTSVDLRMNPHVGNEAQDALDSINRIAHDNELAARR